MNTVKDYDTAMVAEADAQGQPIERMAGPGTTLPQGSDTYFVDVASSGTKITLRSPDGGTETSLRTNLIDEFLGLCDDVESRRDPVTIIWPSASALSRVEAKLARSREPEDRGVASMLRAARSLVNSRVVVLTEALARKLYAPSSVRRGSLEDWMELFGTTDLSVLWGLAMSGFPSSSFEKSSLYFHEFNALSASRFSSARAASSAYRSMNVVNDLVKFRDSLDPYLVDRSIIAGDVSPVRATGSTSGTFTVLETIPPFGMKEGAKAALFTPALSGYVTVTIEDTYIEDGTLMACVSATPKERRKIDTFLGSGSALLTGLPYVPHGRGPSGKWMDRAPQPWSDRGTIPPDIELLRR